MNTEQSLKQKELPKQMEVESGHEGHPRQLEVNSQKHGDLMKPEIYVDTTTNSEF